MLTPRAPILSVPAGMTRACRETRSPSPGGPCITGSDRCAPPPTCPPRKSAGLLHYRLRIADPAAGAAARRAGRRLMREGTLLPAATANPPRLWRIGSVGQPWDVGPGPARHSRRVAAGDRGAGWGCAEPGCGRPASWCKVTTCEPGRTVVSRLCALPDALPFPSSVVASGIRLGRSDTRWVGSSSRRNRSTGPGPPAEDPRASPPFPLEVREDGHLSEAGQAYMRPERQPFGETMTPSNVGHHGRAHLAHRGSADVAALTDTDVSSGRCPLRRAAASGVPTRFGRSSNARRTTCGRAASGTAAST